MKDPKLEKTQKINQATLLKEMFEDGGFGGGGGVVQLGSGGEMGRGGFIQKDRKRKL